MESYQGDLQLFMGAVVTITSLSGVIPYVLPIAGLMSTLIADPAEQHRAAEQWLDETPTGIGPEYGPSAPSAPAVHTEGVSDLTYVRNELKRLSSQIGESEDWQGRAYTSFLDKVAEFDGHLQTLENNRIGCGNTLKCSATAFHALTMICVALAGILVALAAYVIVVRPTPAGPAAEAQAISLVGKMHVSLSNVIRNHWKLVLKVGLILSGAGVTLNQLTRDLPLVKPVSAAKPDLLEARAIWDPAQADIVDDPQAAFDPSAIKSPSPLPELGW
ncbi:hypothetical protein HCN51_36290 [Nonomuraea sp. FMUSA5-5]|uniref:ESX-1 secretion-associated protein EspA/EspE-like domain-containing protein n=1 Tax=Nonomuraea composti TaxID=2720023 RepID=A0ABX1BE59_9ACTN|nr:hypothetical protein [Nonomuraea sp. FMUSA5-5]NJP94835.1 hypothetical protein [Nonomuraea sp. FMUSA5-5]